MKKYILIFITTLTIFFLLSCNTKKKYSKTYYEYLDTVTTITAYSTTKEKFKKATNIIESQLDYYHKLFNKYYEYDGITNLCTLNKVAKTNETKVEKDMIDILQLAKKYYSLTSGKVNVAMGSVISIWHTYKEQAQNDNIYEIPKESTLYNASIHTNINDIIIDENNNTIKYNDQFLIIDLGSIAKGYIAEKIASKLIEQNYTSYILNLGGNIKTIGQKENNKNFTVAIANPNQTKPYLDILSVSNTSVVTSGSYQRYYEVDGIRYHHIIDPDTLFPLNNYLSITVIGNDSCLADVLSTALFNMTKEEGLNLINNLEGYEALWLNSSYETFESNNFYKFKQQE